MSRSPGAPPRGEAGREAPADHPSPTDSRALGQHPHTSSAHRACRSTQPARSELSRKDTLITASLTATVALH